MPRKKKAVTAFDGGEGATTKVVEKRQPVVRKPDPAWAEMQKERRDKRDKKKRRPNQDISFEGYKK